MAYTVKFQALADDAMSQVQGVLPSDVDSLVSQGAKLLDIRDREEHRTDHIIGSLNISRGKLEMNVESILPRLDEIILCYCNANNRGALSAASLNAMGYKNAKYIAGGLNGYRAL